jgi:hypothetical protein
MLHKGRIEGEHPWRYGGPQANTPDKGAGGPTGACLGAPGPEFLSLGG